MKVLSVINLKGGVGKTVSSINIAHILASVHDKKVLFLDIDSQSNATKLFGLYDKQENKLNIVDIITDIDTDIEDVITPTIYENIDLIPGHMKILEANNWLIKSHDSNKGFRLREALTKVEDKYDYCVIDNPPGINITVINALAATDDVIIPIKIDQFTFDGLDELVRQIDNVKEFNEKLKLRGCFVTQFAKNKVNIVGEEFLKRKNKYPIFKTHIRRSVKIDESTFREEPILNVSKRCSAAQDYKNLVKEYLALYEA